MKCLAAASNRKCKGFETVLATSSKVRRRKVAPSKERDQSLRQNESYAAKMVSKNLGEGYRRY